MESEKRIGGEPHHFRVSVSSRLDGADWESEAIETVVRASSLVEALRKAAVVPLPEWEWPDEDALQGPKAGFECALCDHFHQGERLAWICVGCPCMVRGPIEDD